MRYLVGRSSLLLGTILLLVVGMLAYARRDAPATWIVYGVNQNSSYWDFYRMRADGTGRTKIGEAFADYPTGQTWLEDGWMTVNEGYGDFRTFKLIRSDGLTKTLIEGEFQWVNATPFVLKPDTALLTIYSDVRRDDRVTQELDLRTYRLTSIELPATYYSARTILDNGDMIVWSDHASVGDFYRLPHDNPSQLIPLTTRGDILSWRPLVNLPGWVYFYATTPQLSLYRMRETGSDEQLIAEDVLLPDDALAVFGEGAIYYWTGDDHSPQLVRANHDGSDPTILPVAYTGGWQVEQLRGTPYIYYSAYPLDLSPTEAFSRQLLHRLNLETGEDTLLLDGQPFLRVLWTPNREYLLVWVQRETSFGTSYQLIRVRPDGSDPTVVIDDIVPLVDEIIDGHLMIIGPGNVSNRWIRTLDLETFEIRELKDGKPRYANRTILGTTYTPDADSQVSGLVGLGVLLVGVGVASTRLPPFRQRT